MRTFFAVFIAALLLIALTSYGVWTEQRPVGHYLSDLRIQLAVDDGQPGERGNLLGVQAELFPADYQSIDRLHRKLAAYLEQARDKGLINSKTIVVLPEHVGTWLFASGEKNQVYQATTIDEAMTWLSVSNPLKFMGAMLGATGENRLNDAHLRMKATSMAKDYQALFGGLAKEFGVTLVAGSIVLPEPHVVDGKLEVGSGPLFNSSLAFGSDGLPLGQPQRQLYPASYQRGYIQSAADAPLNVIDTPAGRLGILIGIDSWYPRNYSRLNDSGAELIAVPAFVVGNGGWLKPWRGEQSADLTPPVDMPAGSLSEGEAWQRLTLTSKLPGSSARAGVSVFMRGQFWDQGSAGHSFASRNGLKIVEPSLDDKTGHGARLINVWL
ncbi:MAG TPA: nitrilase-related carbon-nitrogen hydrolase [Pseudomonas sp.]|jgi:predicted amidohydrolase|uniref:nitrilase-related carbon-nitrogen hydrolase n=1 Tax=Pseudomonas sp. TaxID=306 RepID=UPI002ED827C8